jgi:phosphoribosylanthranilate isomerase
MPVKVKICGITNLEDAEAALEAGADALGFIFHESSPRAVTIEAAARIAARIPAPVLRVGVFVNAPADFVREALSSCGLTLLQFHGEETPDFCVRFAAPGMRAFRVRDRDSLQALSAHRTEFFLLDAYTPGKPGGTGERFDWNLAIEARSGGRRIFLAGGLTPENAAEAVRRVQPYGIDVSSGVELRPGRKDHAKIRAFIHAARGAAEP